MTTCTVLPQNTPCPLETVLPDPKVGLPKLGCQCAMMLWDSGWRKSLLCCSSATFTNQGINSRRSTTGDRFLALLCCHLRCNQPVRLNSHRPPGTQVIKSAMIAMVASVDSAMTVWVVGTILLCGWSSDDWGAGSIVHGWALQAGVAFVRAELISLYCQSDYELPGPRRRHHTGDAHSALREKTRVLICSHRILQSMSDNSKKPCWFAQRFKKLAVVALATWTYYRACRATRRQFDDWPHQTRTQRFERRIFITLATPM